MRRSSGHWESWWARYGVAAACILGSTAICWGVGRAIAHDLVILVYMATVLASGWYGGAGPGLAALIAGGFLGNHFSLALHGSKAVHGRMEVGFLLAYGVSSLICIFLVTTLRRSRQNHRVLGAYATRAQRKRTENSLLEAKEELERTYDSVPDLLAVINDQHQIMRANRAMAQRLGLSPEQCVGKNCYKLMHGLDAPPDFCPHSKMLADGQEHRVEFHEEHVQGDFLVSATPLRNADGRVVASVHVARDITQHKRTEETLRRTAAAAEEAARRAETANTAKDRFIAMMSHELRTPLTPALAAATALIADHRLPAEVREDMGIIARNIALEAKLIDDLLQITHVATGNLLLRKEQTDVAQILRQVIGICRPDVEAKEQTLTLNMPGPSYPIIADATRLHQVFWNIVKNAIKFTPPGGEISIGCSSSADENSSWLTVSVSDSGMGIEADMLPRVFHPFEQGQRLIRDTFGGLGLGLPIAKAVVEMHGGRIRAESPGHNKGATFTVELPLLAAAPPASPPDGQAAGDRPAANGRPLRILLVEDHADTARLLNRLLANQGHQVTTAGDVSTALTAATTGEFDVMVCDLGLPDGTGHELMRCLLAEGRSLRGIAVSGYGTPCDVKKSQEAGFMEHLTKPIDFQILHTALIRVANNGEAKT